MNAQDEYRELPANEMDMQMMVTNPEWGKRAPPELKAKLKRMAHVWDEEAGTLVLSKQSLWGLLGYYTRDVRLGNLSSWGGEFQYCKYYLDLAGDCLREDYLSAFIVSLSRAVTILELSQSKGGFLRKLLSTLRHEQYTEMIEPQKGSLFGGKKKDKGRER